MEQQPETRANLLEVLEILHYNVLKLDDIPNLFFIHHWNLKEKIISLGYKIELKHLWKDYKRRNNICQHTITNAEHVDTSKKSSMECVTSQKWSVKNVIQRILSKLYQVAIKLI
jgi:hypothetical protein